MYDHYYSSCQGGAYKRGWPEDDRDDGLRFIKKYIAVNHHSPLSSSQSHGGKKLFFHFSSHLKWEHMVRFPVSALSNGAFLCGCSKKKKNQPQHPLIMGSERLFRAAGRSKVWNLELCLYRPQFSQSS